AGGAGIEVPIRPGLMPIANFRNNLSFARKTGVTVPESLVRLFEDLDDDPDTARLVAAKVAAELCLRLRAEGIDIFHFYTLNRPDLVYAVCHMLGLRARTGPLEAHSDTAAPLAAAAQRPSNPEGGAR